MADAIVASHADRTEVVGVPAMGDREGRPYGLCRKTGLWGTTLWHPTPIEPRSSGYQQWATARVAPTGCVGEPDWGDEQWATARVAPTGLRRRTGLGGGSPLRAMGDREGRPYGPVPENRIGGGTTLWRRMPIEPGPSGWQQWATARVAPSAWQEISRQRDFIVPVRARRCPEASPTTARPRRPPPRATRTRRPTAP